jgi:hypothetical protein
LAFAASLGGIWAHLLGRYAKKGTPRFVGPGIVDLPRLRVMMAKNQHEERTPWD